MYREQPVQPPEEVARYMCGECGAALLSGESVFEEGLYGDIVGCVRCAMWQVAMEMQYTPNECPNCGEALEEDSRLVVTDSEVPMACEQCACEVRAGAVCVEWTPQEKPLWNAEELDWLWS